MEGRGGGEWISICSKTSARNKGGQIGHKGSRAKEPAEVGSADGKKTR